MGKEIWKDIKGYEGLYKVSNLGKLKNAKGDIIGKCIIKEGYNRLQLINNHTKKNYLVHRLVALNFIDNPNNYECINHKNGIKTDNRVENLEWCTRKYNNLHAIANGLNIPYVRCIAIGVDNSIQEFNSLKEASIKLNINYNTIKSSASRKRFMKGYLIKTFNEFRKDSRR